jgi:methionyl-tRNA synthetase
MSKSKGNVVDPVELLNTYGKDAVRYYLAAGISFGDDGNISDELVKEMTNGILVNKYSNLVSRTQAMLEQKRESIVPSIKERSEESIKLSKGLDSIKEQYIEEFTKINLTKTTRLIVEALDLVNGYIDITEP